MVAKTAQRKTQRGKQAATEKSVSDFIPYTRHVDDYTVGTKDGYLIQTLKIDGFSFETADQIDLNFKKQVRGTLLRGLANSRFAIYHHIIRREVSQYPEGYFENDFCHSLDERFRETLSDRRMFVNEQYLSIVRRPARGAAGIITNTISSLFGKIDREALASQQETDLKALHDATKKISTTLNPYGVTRLGIRSQDGAKYSDLISFLGYLINLEMRPMRLPRQSLSEYLPQKRLSFGKETLEIRGAAPGDVRLGAVMSIRDYDNVTGPGVLDNLLRLPHEFILTQSFGFIDREMALKKMGLLKRQLASTDEGAQALENDLVDAIDEVASGKSAFGEHHLSLTAIGTSTNELDEVVSDVDAALTHFGIVSVREDLNMEPAFWAMQPGNFAFIARKSLVSTKNFSSFASLHTFPSGKLHGNHWGEPISLLETTSGSPYWFSFHDRDVGNFTLVGPTGAGKTVLLTFLAAQAQRVRPRLIYYDKDRGADIFIRAIGGDYTVIRPGEPTGFNPLQMDDTPTNRTFLREWLALLATMGTDHKLSTEESKIIADAVSANFELNIENRRLSELASLFTGFEFSNTESLSARLAKWHGSGAYAWLFDNPTDSITLNNRIMGFDLTSVLDDPLARTPWLLYNFHRVNALLDGEKVMLILDEGWKMLDDPAFAKRIKDWEKTIRKKNGLLGFATQSTGDIFKNEVGDAIVEQSPTNIFMPNPRADERTYCDGFRLSHRELKIIRTLSPESRCFLVRHGTDSVIARLDLDGLDEFIGVLSGRTETIALADSLRAEHGENPDQWLPHFMKRMKK